MCFIYGLRSIGSPEALKAREALKVPGKPLAREPRLEFRTPWLRQSPECQGALQGRAGGGLLGVEAIELPDGHPRRVGVDQLHLVPPPGLPLHHHLLDEEEEEEEEEEETPPMVGSLWFHPEGDSLSRLRAMGAFAYAASQGTYVLYM